MAECHRITGDDCYLLRLHLRSIDDLEDVLDRFTPYGLTTTSIIHSTPVPQRGPRSDSARTLQGYAATALFGSVVLAAS